jgi:tetratricopeptide (TPR) repeat protein
MKKSVKLTLYVLFAAVACVFGWRFKSNYDALMAAEAHSRNTDIVDVDLPDYASDVPAKAPSHHLGFWGGGLLLSVLGLGLLAARDVSEFIGAKTAKTLFDDTGEIIVTPDYEKAEEIWGRGEFLEAVRILREHLQKNPRAQHIALRIAEIYEKDLHNYLAAALEYEEVLKQKLPPERWGWAAIHLCNLYNGRLNQPDKAIALLRRIDAEHGETAAAEKARTRLAQLESKGLIPSAPAPAPSPQAEPEPEPPFKLPPGFAPKKK